jgi:hypothetical protein
MQFISIPDPRKGPCDIAELELAQKYGAIASSVTPFASQEHWIREAQHSAPHEQRQVPQEGSQGKWWAHRGARSGVNTSQVIEMIFWTGNCVSIDELPHHKKSAAIYSQNTVNFYKEWRRHFEAEKKPGVRFTNGAPELIVETMDAAEAARLNLVEPAYWPFPLGEGQTLRANIALGLNAQTKKLEWFDVGEFIRENPTQSGSGAPAGTLTWQQISAAVGQYYTISAGSGTDQEKAAKFYAAAK